MRPELRAAALPLALILAIGFAACEDDPPPAAPDDETPALTVSTCIDCHSDEEALKATAAPTTADVSVAHAAPVSIIAAGDG
jgi:hypothetical protein